MMSNENPALRQFNGYYALRKPGWKFLYEAVVESKVDEAALKVAKDQSRAQHDHEAVFLLDYLIALDYDERINLVNSLNEVN